jgi:hypothetical protein
MSRNYLRQRVALKRDRSLTQEVMTGKATRLRRWF